MSNLGRSGPFWVEPTAYQERLFARFIKQKPKLKCQKAYELAFQTLIEIDEHESELESTPSASRRSWLEKNIKRKWHKITAPARLGALDSFKNFDTYARKYFSQYGKPKNITEMIRWLKEKGALDRIYRKSNQPSAPPEGALGTEGPKVHTLSEKAARDRLRKRFGIKGRSGRKKKNT